MNRILAAAASVALVSGASLLAQAPPPPPVLQLKPKAPVAPGTPGEAKATIPPAAVAKVVKPEFDLKLERKVKERVRTLANEDEAVLTESTYYTVTLTLLGPQDLSGASVEYRVYYSPPMGVNAITPPEKLEKQGGKLDVGGLKVGTVTTFDTAAFDVPRSVSRGAYAIYADGTRTRSKADLAGVWVRVSVGGVVVYDRAEPDGIKGKAEF